jgi:hypothetical protein
LPKKSWGVHVLKLSASTFLLPVPSKVDFLRRGRLLGAPELEIADGRQGQLVGHERIVGGQCRREKALADQAVGVSRVERRQREGEEQRARG